MVIIVFLAPEAAKLSNERGGLNQVFSRAANSLPAEFRAVLASGGGALV